MVCKGGVAKAAIVVGLSLTFALQAPGIARAAELAGEQNLATETSQSSGSESEEAVAPSATAPISGGAESDRLVEDAVPEASVTESANATTDSAEPDSAEPADVADTAVEDPVTSDEESLVPMAVESTEDLASAEESDEVALPVAESEELPSVRYDAHVQDIGWQSDESDTSGWNADGQTAGVTGESKRLEAVRIVVDSPVEAGGITYQVHVQDYGWLGWSSDGELAGTVGESKRIEALRIALYGDLQKKYSVYYRVHVQDYGWLDWACNGESAGSTGLSLRLEALEVRLVALGSADTPQVAGPAFVSQAAISANGHVQNVGWQGRRTAGVGEVLTVGTTGESLQLEALDVSVSPDLADGAAVLENAHVSNIGWQADAEDSSTWQRADNIVSGTNGTTGLSLAMEAVQLRLSSALAPFYDLYYRAHVADIGWLDWTSNGYVAGSTGLGKQLEALQLCLVRKGAQAPGSTLEPSVGDSLDQKVVARVATSSGSSVSVSISQVGHELYLFLPAFAQSEKVELEYVANDGGSFTLRGDTRDVAQTLSASKAVNLASFTWEENSGNLGTLSYQATSAHAPKLLRIMRSACIEALFLTSADPMGQGREYVESSSDHTLKVKGDTYVLVDAGGNAVEGDLAEIKGRGNSTWALAKRPYQIKTKKKVNLVGGDDSNASKKWVLLANYTDATLLRNYIALNVAQELGLADTPECKSVDLYYDGSYRGTYLLAEKVEVGKGRVGIPEIENSSTDSNDIEDHPTAQATNRYGNAFQYVEGVSSPEDITGGYLLEVDEMYAAERSWFTVRAGGYTYHVVLKSPEDASEAEVRYISECVQASIDRLGTNSLGDFDLESLVRTFLVQELTRNFDYLHASSTYLYKGAGGSSLISGPLWDFDLALGNTHQNGAFGYEGLISEDRAFFIQNDAFRQRVRQVFNEELKPLVRDVLLGSQTVGGLRNVSDLAQNLAASQDMNQCMWGFFSDAYITPSSSYQANVSQLEEWIANRLAWLDTYFNSARWA